MSGVDLVADKMGIDIHEVIRAAATKPFGFVAYTPGPGLGGHCIPIDPFYLAWKAREYGVNTRFIELAGEVNRAMPEWVVGKIAQALNERGRAIKGSRILVLGLAYKKNVDDVRESPAARIMELLRERGALLNYSDPHVPEFPRMREHRFELSSVALDAKSLAAQDCVVLVTYPHLQAPPTAGSPRCARPGARPSSRCATARRAARPCRTPRETPAGP